MQSINCKGRLIDFDVPKVMGILNVTPDSFYDGGKYTHTDTALYRVEQMLKEGADFIDIGAYSSRPGATDISEEEELKRLLPVVEQINKQFSQCLLSIDTFRSKVAHEAIGAGASIINDISAGMLDPEMLNVIGHLQVPYCMMHMRGTPQTMVQATHYDNLLEDMLYYFSERIAAARKSGINDLIIDPGFGFAKTIEQNFKILNNLKFFNIIEAPLLVGLSRKSTIYKSLQIDKEEALNGTTVLHTLALQQGASILRVHDVKEAVEAVKLFTLTTQSGA